MKLPCVLLAAGGSTRMGRNKLLLRLGGETVVHRTARIALAFCSPLIVVTGSEPEQIRAALADFDGLRFVHNPDWALGMASSAIAGIAELSGIEGFPSPELPGFFLHHADMPFVPPAVYELLAGEARQDRTKANPRAVRPAFHGIPGHPVYFPSAYIPEIQKIHSGESLKPVLSACGSALVETGEKSVIDDCDTPEDFCRLAEAYGLGLERGEA